MDYFVNEQPPPIILIGGTGRSGTNITKTLLSRHPAVASLPFEHRFLIDPDGLVDFYRSFTAAWSPYLADRRIKRLEALLLTLAKQSVWSRWLGNIILKLNRDGRTLSPRWYHRWNLNASFPNFESHVQALIAELRDFTFPAAWSGTESYTWHPRIYHAAPKSRQELAPILGKFVNRVTREYLTKTGKTFFVEDNTWNILFARELLEILPQAKILHVYRDPRDVVASCVHQRWCPSNLEQAASWYLDLMTYWFTVRTDLPPQSYYELKLEDLVAQTETVVQKICQFAELPYHPAMLKTDLSKSRNGRWRHDFSPEEQHRLQNILGKIAIELGYR